MEAGLQLDYSWATAGLQLGYSWATARGRVCGGCGDVIGRWCCNVVGGLAVLGVHLYRHWWILSPGTVENRRAGLLVACRARFINTHPVFTPKRLLLFSSGEISFGITRYFNAFCCFPDGLVGLEARAGLGFQKADLVGAIRYIKTRFLVWSGSWVHAVWGLWGAR
jgi:hypothetical protein